MREAARELGVTRQTLYYWIKKEWIKPKRDYRNYPVFTKEDVEGIKQWREKLEA
jgi:DNA-binding transcriptional MerR regulator